MVRIKEYERNEIELLWEYHTCFQACISIIAHKNMGLKVEKIEGINKFEGGIRLNGREIAIKPFGVIDDFQRTEEATLEEDAVAKAIEFLNNFIFFRDDGSIKFSFEALFLRNFTKKERDLAYAFIKDPVGDPLRYFLRNDSLQ